MAEQYTPNLGSLCGPDARRDAVHIAVAPVQAGEELRPGEHVGLLRGVAVGDNNIGVELIGIVDPFVKAKQVYEGETFWLFLYPGTITSLRHVWSHPAFTAKPSVKEIDHAP